MKFTYRLLAIFSCILLSQCSKERTFRNDYLSDRYLSDSALTFLQHTLTNEDYIALDPASIRILKNAKQPIAIRIAEKGSNDQKFVLLRKTANTFEGNKVDLSGLIVSQSKSYSGEIILKNFQNNLLKIVTVKNNRAVQVKDPSERVKILQQPKQLNRTNDTISAKTLDEVFVIGHNPAPAPDYASMYWLFNQYSSYENIYYTNYQVGSGTEAAIKDSVNQVSVAPTYISPDHPVKNIVQELRCFTISSQNTYSVSVNVNEPNPTTRELTNLAAEHMAGHTFITLKEQFPDGSTMVRNIGFYPMNSAKPGSGVDKSVFGDDSETPYSVSLSIALSAAEFSTFRNAVYGQQDRTYFLDGFNCTNSVMTSFNAINVTLPSTIGRNAFFIGNNPADIGEDIRELELNKFSSENGSRKVVRSVSNQNDLTAPARKGGC